MSKVCPQEFTCPLLFSCAILGSTIQAGPCPACDQNGCFLKRQEAPCGDWQIGRQVGLKSKLSPLVLVSSKPSIALRFEEAGYNIRTASSPDHLIRFFFLVFLFLDLVISRLHGTCGPLSSELVYSVTNLHRLYSVLGFSSLVILGKR